VKIARQSQLSGMTHVMDIDISPEQYANYCLFTGAIQKIFPNLSDDEREFLLTGITKEEWDTIGPK